MIKRLRRQLTALFTITTGLILTLVVIGILVISAREFNKKNLDSFQNQILNITSRLQSGSTVSCTWPSRLESDNRLIIHIEDNGRPLLYHGSWTPDTRRDTLIMRAREAAMAERIDPSSRPVSSSLLRSSVFTVTGDSNDTYLGSVLVLPTDRISEPYTAGQQGLHGIRPVPSGYPVPSSQSGWYRRADVRQLDIGGEVLKTVGRKPETAE